jgi:hypothetical protein
MLPGEIISAPKTGVKWKQGLSISALRTISVPNQRKQNQTGM